MLTRKQYVDEAKLILTEIRSVLTHGSNHISDINHVDFQYGNAIRSAVPIIALLNALHGINPSHHVFAKLYFLAIKKYGYGQCGELSQAAFMKLVDKGIFPIDLCTTTVGGHNLLILGRSITSDPTDISTWGDNAVVCDPWANQTYPLSEFQDFQKKCAESEYNPEIYRVLKSATPPPSLNGTLSIQYSVVNKSQLDEFHRQAIVHPELLRFFEKLPKNDAELTEDLIDMESKLAALNNSFLSFNPGAIPQLVNAAQTLNALRIGLSIRNDSHKKNSEQSKPGFFT